MGDELPRTRFVHPYRKGTAFHGLPDSVDSQVTRCLQQDKGGADDSDFFALVVYAVVSESARAELADVRRGVYCVCPLGARTMSNRVRDHDAPPRSRPSGVGVPGDCVTKLLMRESLTPKTESPISIWGSPSTNM